MRSLLRAQATMAVVEGGEWEPGQDPVTLAAGRELIDEQNFVRDGELMPIEEVLADPDRSAAFFDGYLRAQDGGAGVVLELDDQIQGAVGASSRSAKEDFDAGGG